MYQNKPGNIWFVLILFSCGLQSQPAFAALPKNALIDGGITMNTITIDSKNVQMIAHRGVSGIEMENTAAAFVAAGNRSYFGIETDVHVTKDGKIAVIHDDNTLRVSGIDRIVEETTLEELQTIPLYNKAEGCFRTDLKIPVLADYISICKRYDKKAVL